MNASVRLRAMRERLGLTIRDVESASDAIAQKYTNEDYAIPLSRLSDIETKGVVPSIYRLYSLAVIYKCEVQELLSVFGIDVGPTKVVSPIASQAIEFYSCFLSYSTKDQEFAERLHADLDANGVSCWFAPRDVRAGRKLEEQIDEAIRLYDKLLLILSATSMESEWVKTEISKARRREVDQKRQVLFPVRLVSFEEIRKWKYFDTDTGKDSAREIREYFIPDFSNWRDQPSYQVAFRRLLLDLTAETSKPSAENSRALVVPVRLNPRFKM